MTTPIIGMNRAHPRVTIGLPVFNGEQYLCEALDSLLAQTYSEFVLIISDNASTDRTSEICREYAVRDPRVRYERHSTNIGAMQNWYSVFDLSSGEYFLGAADDDVYHPEFLARCLDVLDRNPDVVICHTRTRVIDERSEYVKDFVKAIDTMSPKPHVRLYNVLGVDYLCIQLLGVFRSSAFRKTKIHSGYAGCDWNVLVEFSLLGKIYEIPEFHFSHRLYLGALGVALHSGRTLEELIALDPGVDWRRRVPALLKVRNYFWSVARAPIGRLEKLLCYRDLLRLMVEKSAKRIMRRPIRDSGDAT